MESFIQTKRKCVEDSRECSKKTVATLPKKMWTYPNVLFDIRVLPAESMLPNKLKRHLKPRHSN